MEFCRGPRIGDHSDVPTFERFAVRDVDGGIENLLTEVLSPRAGREGASGLWIHVHGKVKRVWVPDIVPGEPDPHGSVLPDGVHMDPKSRDDTGPEIEPRQEVRNAVGVKYEAHAEVAVKRPVDRRIPRNGTVGVPNGRVAVSLIDDRIHLTDPGGRRECDQRRRRIA